MCESLVKITISSSVTIICYAAFIKCESLEIVKFPEGISFIDENAFRRCKKLKSVTIPDSVFFIGKNAFIGCPYFKCVFTTNKEVFENISFTVTYLHFHTLAFTKKLHIPEKMTKKVDCFYQSL